MRSVCLDGTSVFKALTDSDMMRWALHFVEATVEPGYHFTVQGKTGTDWYLVMAGDVDVVVNDVRVRTLGKHSWFGEGAALSGKTTLSFMLSKQYDVPVISTGSLLRDAAYDNPTEIGIKAKEYLDGSKTVPDEFMFILAKKRIAEDDCVRKGYIFDGFPRTPAQVEMLTEADILLDKVRIRSARVLALFRAGV